nr:glycoside hydrolase family 3 C-terminal domain-containing protein [Candidatus Paceibacterota bacterium]
IGLGGMVWGTSGNENYKIDQGYTFPNDSVLRAEYLLPFKAVVDAGAKSIMVGLNTWGDGKLSANKYLITDVLKKELGFKGFVVSDWYGIYEIPGSDYRSAIVAINAGVDMVMLPFDYKPFIRNVVHAVENGEISEDRIDDAVRRILRAKFKFGLFDKDETETSLEIIGSPEHRALAREAVAQSLVLLKNEDDVLPIDKNINHIRVAGSAANNIGNQSGAWTVNWQGINGNDLPGATSILEGIKKTVSEDTKVDYSELGNFKKSDEIADLGIAVVGEQPYAEGVGDREYPILYSEDLMAIKKLQETSKKVVVVIISGRPLFIANEISSWDALIAAWLPGSEGQGIADVIFGDKPFVGKLPLPWPHHSEQLPILENGKTHDNTPLLFPRYFGL